MWGVVSDTRSAVSDDAYFVINTPTNISIAEPAFIIAAALKEQLKNAPPTHDLPTLSSRIRSSGDRVRKNGRDKKWEGQKMGGTDGTVAIVIVVITFS
jgi:hypothetical protein